VAAGLEDPMKSEAKGVANGVRVAAALLIAGLVAGPALEHVYWILGGTWGLEGAEASRGIRVVSAIVVLLVVLGVLVILARVGLWQQAFVSERAIRILAWVLPVFFLGEALAAFGRRALSLGGTDHWELYGPVSLVLGLLALVVAGSDSTWRRLHRPHRTLPSH
jgi:hypothetical protein